MARNQGAMMLENSRRQIRQMRAPASPITTLLKRGVPNAECGGLDAAWAPMGSDGPNGIATSD